MKQLLIATAAISLTLGASGAALAQPHDDHMAGRAPMAAHHDWHKGDNIAAADWRRGRVVDYRSSHLRKPPRGYQWRDMDGNYVLAAIAGGAIADLIAHQ